MVEQEPLLCADSSLLPGKAPPGLFILHEWRNSPRLSAAQSDREGFFVVDINKKKATGTCEAIKDILRLFQPGFSVEIVSKNMTGVLCWCRRYHLLSLGLCISITQAVMNHSPGTLSLGLT